MTYRQLGESMDSGEFTEWLAYDRVEPIPYPWLQTGVVAASACNASGNYKRPFKPADFMPIGARTRRQTPAQVRHALGSFFDWHNAVLKARTAADPPAPPERPADAQDHSDRDSRG